MSPISVQPPPPRSILPDPQQRSDPMHPIQPGQCGLCTHFGENQPQEQPKLIQIRTAKQAPEDLVEECGPPRHASLHLVVTPISGCQGFMPAPVPGRMAGA